MGILNVSFQRKKNIGFFVKTVNEQIVEKLKSISDSASNEEFLSIINEMKNHLSYKEVELFFDEISNLKSFDKFINSFENEKYYWTLIIDDEYKNQIDEAKKSLCTSDFLAYLIGIKNQLNQFENHNIFGEMYKNIGDNINKSIIQTNSILCLETSKKQHIPVNYGFSMFFLHEKKEGLAKFKRILNNDRLKRLEASHQAEYIILFDKFFDRLDLNFIPKINFDNNNFPIDFNNSEKKYITKEEIRLIIDREDYFNKREFTVPIEYLLTNNNFKKKELLLKSFILYFEFNESKISKINLEIMISCFTDPNPPYDKFQIANSSKTMRKYLLDNSKIKEFIYFLYYLISNRTLIDSKTKLPILLNKFLHDPKGMSKQTMTDIFSNRDEIEHVFEKTLPKNLLVQVDYLL